jgi:hypothetical protein
MSRLEECSDEELVMPLVVSRGGRAVVVREAVEMAMSAVFPALISNSSSVRSLLDGREEADVEVEWAG